MNSLETNNALCKKTKILIVDDQQTNIQSLSAILKEEYTIMGATSGAKALEIARSKKKPDLILLDVQMPEMDGYEVLRRIQSDESTRDIPVIFVTAKNAQGYGEFGLELGAVDYISKPYIPGVVKLRVKQMLDRMQSNVPFSTLYKSSSDAIMLLDDTGFLDCNQATLTIFGVKSVEAFCALHPADLSPSQQEDGSDSMTAANEKIESAMRVGSNRFEWSHKRHDTGEVFPAEIFLTLMELGGKQVLQASVLDISKRKQTEEELRLSNYNLGERIKELNCLYAVSRLVEEYDSLENIVQGTVEIILPSWQFPEITCARITLEDRVYQTGNFKESAWMQSAPIKVNGIFAGRIDVGFLEEKPEADEGPFLKNERLLLDAMAERLGRITERKQAEENLKTQKERLNNILEATNAGTWEWNVQTGETIFNEKWANIIGYTLKEISPVSIDTRKKFAHPDDLKESDELLEKHFNGELEYYHFESRMKHKDGSWIWVLDRGKVITRDDNGKPLWAFGTHQDITVQKLNEEKIRHLATHDALTNLPGLRLANDRISLAIESAERKQLLTGTLFVDLDGFKSINDSHGHDAGDAVLREVAKRLVSCVRKTDTVARIGGDEFLLVITEFQNADVAESIAKKIINTLTQPMPFNGIQLTVGASIGIAIYPTDSNSADSLIKKADEAMYVSKKSGKNQFTFANAENP